MDESPQTEEIAHLGQILSSETRVRIISLLRKRPLCVGALSTRLQISQGAVSQHLRILRDAGLVTRDRRGYYIHYALVPGRMAQIRSALADLLDTEGIPDGHECDGDHESKANDDGSSPCQQ